MLLWPLINYVPGKLKVEGGAGEATNLQDELNEAIKTTQKNAKGTEETTVEFSEIFDKETRERFQALEQVGEDVVISIHQKSLSRYMYIND